MTLPVQITFRHCDQSEAIVNAIHDRADKLDQFFNRIHTCHVVVEAPHNSHNKGNWYRVRVDVTVPGEELVVGQDRSRKGKHEDIYLAIRDAFDAAQRQLQEYAHRLRREIKHHTEFPPMPAQAAASGAEF